MAYSVGKKLFLLLDVLCVYRRPSRMVGLNGGVVQFDSLFGFWML